jgi:adenine-specific DNA-methyltransferase
LYYGIVYNLKENKLLFDKDERYINKQEEIIIYPSPDGKIVYPMSKSTMKEYYEKGLINVFQEKDRYVIKIKRFLFQNGYIKGNILKSILSENKLDEPIGGTNEATKEYHNLFGEGKFETQKPVNLIKLLFYTTTQGNDTILDFFAGSGTTAHAVMKLNKEDGGKRKFILVEMADYFDAIIISRIKKIAYSFNWKDGKPQDKDGIGVFFKYQYLEQYEDSLNNIELKEDQKAQELFKDEYLLKYFLDFKTKDNLYLLNIENLKNPFVYKLKVSLSEVGKPQEVIVDIPETFNYLLGIKLKKIKKRKNNGKDYLFILGEKEGQNYAIVWRELSGNEEEVKKDKEFIKKELKDWRPQLVYVNCPENTVLTPDFGDFQVEIRYIEPEFKKLMETMNYET